MRAIRRAGALAAGLVILTALVTVPGAAQAAGPQDLQLSSPAVSTDSTLSVLATVPPELSGLTLPATSFTATQDGQPVPVTASRVLDGPAELVVVLDVSTDADTLAAEQSAAADLLREVPSQTPTTVLPGGDRTTASGALGRVGALRRVPGARLLDGLPAAPAVRRYVVVLAGCPAVNDEHRGIPGGDTQVSVLSVGSGCEASAPALAGVDPGVVHSGLDPGDLLASVDEVARSVLGQYVVRSTGPVGPGPVHVALRVGATVAGATIALPARAPAGHRRSGDPVWPVVAAAVLAALVTVLLGVELLARRRTALAP